MGTAAAMSTWDSVCAVVLECVGPRATPAEQHKAALEAICCDIDRLKARVAELEKGKK